MTGIHLEMRLEKSLRVMTPGIGLLKIRRSRPRRDDGYIEAEVVDDLYVGIEVREYEDQYHAIMQVRIDPLILLKNDGLYFSKVFKEGCEGLHNCFQLSVDKEDREVRFGPIGNIMVWPDECRGLGLASYAFSKLIKWAQAKYLDYRVGIVNVSEVDARDPENKVRRNRFYAKHGFRGSFSNASEAHGVFLCDGGVKALIPHEPKDSIDVLDVSDFLRTYLKRAHEREREIHELTKSCQLIQEREECHADKSEKKNKIIAGLVFVIIALCWILSQ